MSDLRVYIDGRKKRDPEFSENYDKGFHGFKLGVPLEEKPIAIWRSCFELITRALVFDEDFTPEAAAEFIANGCGSERDMLPRIREKISVNSQAPIDHAGNSVRPVLHAYEKDICNQYGTPSVGLPLDFSAKSLCT